MKKKRYLKIGFILLVLIIAFIVIGFLRYQLSIVNVLEKNVYNYFKANNAHIASRDFRVTNLKIICKGKKAYIVDFSITFKDDESKLTDLGAFVYKEDKEWHVESILNSKEIVSFDLKCYKKK